MNKSVLLLLFTTAILTGFSQDCEPPTNPISSIYFQDVTLTWNAPPTGHFLMQGDYLDLQFSFPCSDAAGQAGVESDGSYIYSAVWNNNYFVKYEFDGSLVDTFDIAGVSGVRDMAFCETDGFMYGTAPNISKIYKMDFNNLALVEVIDMPNKIRAIAFDPDLDVFYGNNWSGDVIVLDRTTGLILDSVPLTGAYGSYYGFAYDNWSVDGPFVWGFSQDGSGAELVQLRLPDFSETGVAVDIISLIPGSSGIAGGLFTQPGIVEGKVTLGGLLQNEIVFGLELGDVPMPPPNVILAGYNIFRDGDLINTDPVTDTTFIDIGLDPGTYQYEITAVYEDTLGAFVCESDPAGPVSALIEESWLLGGNVFVGDFKLDEGQAHGYKYEGGNILHQSTVEITDMGYYFFVPFETGDYYVKVDPSVNSANYGDYVPTYYGDVYHWENSPTVHLQANVYNADVNLIPVAPSNTGPGRIAGNVSFENKYLGLAPAGNIQFLLLNNSDECISFSYSDDEGHFCFNGLENGTYKLLCEIIGKKMTPMVFVIDNDNPVLDGINFIIKDNEIVMGIGDGLPENINFLSNVFPNPSQNEANIYIETAEPVCLNVRIVNCLGQEVLGKKVAVGHGRQLIELDVSNLGTGYYQLLVSGDSISVVARKFIKL